MRLRLAWVPLLLAAPLLMTESVHPPSARADGTGSQGGSVVRRSSAPSAAAAPSPASAASPRPENVPPGPTFARDIAPLFAHRCNKCHGAPFARNDLRLTTYENALRGGEAGVAIVPGNPDASLLVQKVEGLDEPTMPPRRPLTKRERRLVRRWVAEGALP